MRAFAREAFDSLPRDATLSKRALGSSGTINAVVGYAGRDGKGATREEVARAADDLAAMSVHERRHRFDARRAEIIVAGAVILDCAMHHFRLSTVQAVNRGLRDGMATLLRRENLHRGVDVREVEGQLSIDVYVIVLYGIRITEVARNLQDAVRFEVERATGVAVAEVNVFVQGVHGDHDQR